MRVSRTPLASSSPNEKIHTKAEGGDVFGDMLGDAIHATPATNAPTRSAGAEEAPSPRIGKEESGELEQPTSGTACENAIQPTSDGDVSAANGGGGTLRIQDLLPLQGVLPATALAANFQAESGCSSATMTRTGPSGGQSPRPLSWTKTEKDSAETSSACSARQTILVAVPLIPVQAKPVQGSVGNNDTRESLCPIRMPILQANAEPQTRDSDPAKEPTTSKRELENATGDIVRAESIAAAGEHAVASVSQGEFSFPAQPINIDSATSPLPVASSVQPASSLQPGTHPATDAGSSVGDNTDNAANTSTISSKTGKPGAGDNTVTSTASSNSQTSVPAHGQITAEQSVSVQARGLDINTSLAQIPTIHGVANETNPKSSGEGGNAGAGAAEASTDDLPHASELAGSDTASGINSARLIQAMGQTEMQVGMRSTEFGDVSIRASISQQQMLAQISVNHSDLSQAMMAHLPSVQTKIGNDHGLQTSISVQHQGAAAAGDGGQSSQRERQAWVRQDRAFGQPQQSSPGSPVQPVPSAVAAANRLDIRA